MSRNEHRRPGGACPLFFIILLITGTAAGIYYWFSAVRVPARVILEADFDQGVIEEVPEDALARLLLSKRLPLRDVVEALQKASGDGRVRGLVARVGRSRMKLAHVQELRDAVIAFRAAGKPAIAYAETFGEFGPGNGAYYLATAFDAAYLQPSGSLGLTGLIFEQSFVRGALDKLGIIPRVDGRKEYKTYRYKLTERGYIKPHREAVTGVMESQFSQIVSGIAAARGLPEERVRDLIDEGPFLGEDAVDAKLIDGLAYRDEVYDRIREKAGAKAELLPLTDYLGRAGGPYEKGTTVALIYGAGDIIAGKSGYEPATGSVLMGADTVAEAFRQAVKDEDVKAILFRIDSPGGSYVASDTILREVMNARKAGKPVIASLSGVAGSGGYFVALAADRIVAQPATITGSIGVFGGKMVTTGLWNKLGVTWDEVHTSKNADSWSMTRDFTPVQLTRMETWLDRVYDDFTLKVSQGRKLSREEVEKIAKGRIWTGEDAKRLGLVDELGGFPAALQLVRAAAKIPAGAAIRLKTYPAENRLIRFLARLRLIKAEGESSDALAHMLEEAQPVMRTIKSLGIVSPANVLRMTEEDGLSIAD